MATLAGLPALGIVLRFVVFMGVAAGLWAWRRERMERATRSWLPPALFSVAWVLVYASLAVGCAAAGGNRTQRALMLAAVAVTWAWIVLRPESAAAGFALIVVAIALLLAAWANAGMGSSGKDRLAKASLALPIAWLVAALALSATGA
jgi:hypothetical protein